MTFTRNTPPSQEPQQSIKKKEAKLIFASFEGFSDKDLAEKKSLENQIIALSANIIEDKILNEDKEKKISIKKARIKEIDDKCKQFESLLIVVSLFQSYYMNEYLEALISLIQKFYMNQSNPYKKINFYIAGLLQRHNFWNFTSNDDLKEDANLEALIKDIIIDKTGNISKQLADQLAVRFTSRALEAENKAYFDLEYLIRHAITNPEYKIYRWNDLTPVLDSENNDPRLKQNLQNYRRVLEQAYANEEIEPNEAKNATNENEPRVNEEKQQNRTPADFYQKKVDTFLSRIIGDDPLVESKKTPYENELQRYNLINREASRILKILKLSPSECTEYQLAKACGLNFVLEECSGFPILHNGDWSGLGYPVSGDEEAFFRANVRLMKHHNYINAKSHLPWVPIVFQDRSDLACNLGVPKHEKKSKASSCTFEPQPAVLDPHEFNLNDSSETKHETDMQDEKLETHSAPAESELKSEKPQTNSILESMRAKPVENYNWLKYPDRVINHIKSLRVVALSCNFSLYPGITRLNESLDNIYKQNFITIILSIPAGINFLSLQYVAKHFSYESARDIFLSFVKTRKIKSLDLSNNNLFMYSIEDLIEIFRPITESLILTNNQLYQLGEEKLILLIQSFTNVEIIDLSDNDFHSFHYKVLARIFEKIPTNIEVLRLDSYCFKKFSNKELFELLSALPKTVSLDIEGGSSQLKEKIEKMMEIREAEYEMIDKLIQQIKKFATKTYLRQEKEPISTFFLHNDSDKKFVQAQIEMLHTVKTLKDAIKIIEGLLSRKGATLYKNSFDTIYIKSFYDSTADDLGFYTIISSYGIPKFKIEFPKHVREENSSVTIDDRIELVKSFTNLLSKFESYKQNTLELEQASYTNHVVRKYSY